MKPKYSSFASVSRNISGNVIKWGLTFEYFLRIDVMSWFLTLKGFDTSCVPTRTGAWVGVLWVVKVPSPRSLTVEFRQISSDSVGFGRIWSVGRILSDSVWLGWIWMDLDGFWFMVNSVWFGRIWSDLDGPGLKWVHKIVCDALCRINGVNEWIWW